MAVLLSKTRLEHALGTLPGWTCDGDTIVRDFTMENFARALGFVVAVGARAEAADHHPDILLHDWKKVKIMLTTHSSGGVTENDVQLAKQIDELLK